MKVNGRILTYPLGFTDLQLEAAQTMNRVTNLENALSGLTSTLTEAVQLFDEDGNPDTDNVDELSFADFVTKLNELLRTKADLEDTTDDGVYNPTVVSSQGLQWIDV